MKHWRETSEIVDRVLALAANGRRAALATVVEIKGSSYRRPGAKFLIDDDGRTLGGVSGGCLEADVREVAQRVMQTGTPRLLHYDTGADDRTVWGLGLGCNGSVDIFVQPATEARALNSVRELAARLRGARSFAIATQVDGPGDVGRLTLSDATPAATSHLDVDGSRTVFIEVLHPPPPLIICGAGDDARPLAMYATEAGFAVTVVDHREAFLAAERFPAASRRLLMRPDEASVETVGIGPGTMVVIMTHSFGHDRNWLKRVLDSPAQYIGLLGPRARADEMLAQLDGAADGRVFAPVGLNLGADGPEQIAMSVVSELLACLSRRQPGHLREKREAIHAF